jgi:chemotaxis-related protein WspB
MLFLLFRLGRERYALEATDIVEVLSLITIKQIPGTPPEVEGVFDYHGKLVPAIDLSLLALGFPARRRLSTRIILVRYADERGYARIIGLIVERATELLRRERADFAAPEIANESTPYLGPITRDERGLIQWIAVRDILSESVRTLLFVQPVVS